MILIRRVNGKSMLPTLQPAQLVIFRRTFGFKINQIVLAKVDQLEVVKRLIRLSPCGAYLQGDNPQSLAYFVKTEDLKAVLFLKL